MTRDKIKEGDICTLDESVEYLYNPHKPYEVVVLWHGVNSQPLVTKLDAYKPFWTTYSQLIEVKRHIDLSIKALEQQTCEDAISREDALMALTGEWTEPTDELIHRFIRRIKKLPSVKPQPKTGKWIDIMVGDMPAQACDQCNTFYPLAYTGGGHKYCPNCGCRMVEQQESEVEG